MTDGYRHAADAIEKVWRRRASVKEAVYAAKVKGGQIRAVFAMVVSDLPCNIRREGRAIPCNWRATPCNIRREGW